MNKEQIINLINEFQANASSEGVFKVDNSFKGMGKILYTLYTSEEKLSLSDFSQILNVSCARVTNLVKKLEKSELVRKDKDKSDNRTTYLYLTPKGEEFTKQKFEKIVDILSKLVDSVGEDKFTEYIETTRLFKNKLDEIVKEEKLC